VATRQTSSSGRAKSPRIQVVLPEELLERLAVAADQDSRTVSNMAKVLIQQGLDRLQGGVRHQLERQQQVQPRLRQGQLRRIRLRGG
jgi:predicted DNA-binding protein